MNYQFKQPGLAWITRSNGSSSADMIDSHDHLVVIVTNIRMTGKTFVPITNLEWCQQGKNSKMIFITSGDTLLKEMAVFFCGSRYCSLKITEENFSKTRLLGSVIRASAAEGPYEKKSDLLRNNPNSASGTSFSRTKVPGRENVSVTGTLIFAITHPFHGLILHVSLSDSPSLLPDPAVARLSRSVAWALLDVGFAVWSTAVLRERHLNDVFRPQTKQL